MLFHMTNTHTPENCSAHKPERLKIFAAVIESAEENGVHIHSLCVAAPEHTFYGVFETDSAESLERWLDPVPEFGTARITPATDVLTAIGNRLESGLQA